MAPMGTNYASPEGYITERNKLYYQTRAKGGVGLIIVEAAHLDPIQRHRPKGICINDDVFIPGLTELTEAVHESGVPILQQLLHPGRIASSKATGIEPVSASPIPHPISGVVPRPLTVDEIQRVEELFKDAAIRAQKAGFDGVEIHGAHGYLVGEFVSPYSNKRMDEYGGSIENRIRFPLEIVRMVREEVGPDFLISYRMSATEFLPEGLSLEDARYLAAELEKAGVNLLHVSAGVNEQPRAMAKVIPLSYTQAGCFAHLAASIKEVVKIPVVAVGRINSPNLAEEILKTGQADLVALGRGLIADSFWPKKAEEGRLLDINMCIACNEGCIGRLNRNESIGCTVNPWVGQIEETDSSYKAVHLDKKKVIMVIGGGPGGMRAAVEIAKRGHKVTLFEKEKLGGLVNASCKPPGKEEMINLVNYLSYQLQKCNVTVELGREITKGDIINEKPEAIILATGSKPVLPPIKGISLPYVFTAEMLLKGQFDWQAGTKFVVVGAGMVGLEVAHFLSSQGKEVHVVEIAEAAGTSLSPMVLTVLLDKLEDCKVRISLGTEIREIGADHSLSVYNKGSHRLETLSQIDYVIVSAGYRSDDALEESLKDGDGGIKFYKVGDCKSPRKIIDAVSEGANLGVWLAGE